MNSVKYTEWTKNLKEGVALVKQKSPIKITPEVLEEFDNYVKNTDLEWIKKICTDAN